MRAFNIGIIGYGGFGKFLHNYWSQLGQVRVVAVADEVAHKLQGLGSIRAFADWRNVLQEKDIDVVAIATVPNTHARIAAACMEAGKHILIEKPLAINRSDAQKTIQVRDKKKAIAAVDFIMRFNPLLQAIRSLTQQEIFGKLRRVAVENYAQDQLLPPEHWFWQHDRSGGILIEHGVHFIDLVHYLHPAKMIGVNGLKHNRSSDMEDQIMANVVYEGGLIATHYHSFARPGFFEATTIKLAYDLGDIELHGWIPLWADVKALVNSQTKQILLSNPFFEFVNSIPVEKASDESRPAGWGSSDSPDNSNRRSIRSGGISYDVDQIITGKFQTNRPKQDVYASCVQASLLDVLTKIENPAHQLTAPLETGLESLEVAIRATESARNEGVV